MHSVLNTFEQNDRVTAIHTSMVGRYIVFGTEKGWVKAMDRNSGALQQQLDYRPHTKAVTCVSVRDGFSIVSSSADGTLYVKFLTPGK